MSEKSPAATTTMATNLCINCKHHQEYTHRADTRNIYHFCGHPIYGVNLVTGEAITQECKEARRAVYGATRELLEGVPGHCGPHGQFFEVRTSAPISTASATTEASVHGSGNNA